MWVKCTAIFGNKPVSFDDVLARFDFFSLSTNTRLCTRSFGLISNAWVICAAHEALMR